MSIESRSESGSPTSAAETAYVQIKDQIIQGTLQAGARLPESDLAASLGISRTPVREALRRLAVEGFVEFFSNRGAQVTVYTDRDIDEVFELRTALEGLAARLAATRVTPLLIRRLRELADVMDTVPMTDEGLDRMTAANNEFHRLVVEASGNKRLAETRAHLVIIPIVRRTFHSYTKEELDRSRLNHRELIDALETGNAQWAESVAMTHILAAQASMRDWQSRRAGTSPDPSRSDRDDTQGVIAR